MKKPLLLSAVFGLTAMAAGSVMAVPAVLGTSDYADFSIIDDKPSGTTFLNYSSVGGVQQITVLFGLLPGSGSADPTTSLAVDPTYQAFWGEDDGAGFDLSAMTTLSAYIGNSSSTVPGNTSDDINFGLFVEAVNADFSTTYFLGDSVQALADNESATLVLDIQALGLTTAQLSNIQSYGLYVGSEVITVAHANVPEPSTLAILGGGLLAFGYIARRRKVA